MVEGDKKLTFLIEGCRKKNRKAQYEIYNRYFKAMYNTACRIIGDTYTAEDITQEAFLSAFNKIKTYKGEVTFGAWIKKIVVNKSIDYLRKRKLNLEFDDKIQEIEIVDEPEFNNNDSVELLNIVKQAISQLPDGYRMVSTLYILEGYDYDEISEILKIKSSTVRSQFTRAKIKLIEILNTKS